MGEAIHKSEFTDVGELIDTPEYGPVIRLIYGKALWRLLRAAKFVGKRLEVSMKVLRYQRSQAQNRWLWGVAYLTISAWYRDTQGESISKEAIHAHTLRYILDYRIEVETIFGQEVLSIKGKSTSALNTKEFTELVEKLVAYWAEKGCEIPLPKDNNFISDHVRDEAG